MSTIKAVIFDMDGVLVDSEPYICKAAITMFERMGINVVASDFEPFIGAGENRYLGGVAEKYGIDVDIEKIKKETYDIYGKLIKGQLVTLPGVHDFLDECRRQEFKTAIATSTDYVKMKASLDEIGLDLELFEATIDGLMVERRKPYPDIYEMAASTIGVDPKHCLVVEDSVSGITAAKSAGAKCLALETSFSPIELSEADWILPDLSAYREILADILT